MQTYYNACLDYCFRGILLFVPIIICNRVHPEGDVLPFQNLHFYPLWFALCRGPNEILMSLYSIYLNHSVVVLQRFCFLSDWNHMFKDLFLHLKKCNGLFLQFLKATTLHQYNIFLSFLLKRAWITELFLGLGPICVVIIF